MPKKWRGQSATLEMTGGSLPADPFGVLQDVTIAPAQEVSELRGAGDVRWVDLQRTSVSLEITATVMSWDEKTWDILIDYDEAAGELNPSADVPTFSTTVEWEAADGSTKEIEMAECYMDPPPEIGGSRDEWAGMSLSITARQVTNINNTDASA
jgi:hypothetical protein